MKASNWKGDGSEYLVLNVCSGLQGTTTVL